MPKKLIFPTIVIIASVAMFFIVRAIVPSPNLELTKEKKGRANPNDYIVYIKNENTNDSTDTNSTSTNQGQITQIAENAISYQEAIAQYEGRRIQFNNCEATPKQVTFANDTKIMLDGRSAEGQKITINNQEILLNSYEFAFVTLKSDSLPKEININCQASGETLFNTAQIVLQ